jgi:hypothetical protein
MFEVEASLLIVSIKVAKLLGKIIFRGGLNAADFRLLGHAGALVI